VVVVLLPVVIVVVNGRTDNVSPATTTTVARSTTLSVEFNTDATQGVDAFCRSDTESTECMYRSVFNSVATLVSITSTSQ
jgi:hypothetical protein